MLIKLYNYFPFVKLILMRHAEALSGTVDFERNLSEIGKKDAFIASRLLLGTKWAIGEIRSSPLVRALETQKILSQELAKNNLPIQCVTDEILKPSFSFDKAIDLLDKYEKDSVSIWIFHAPDISYITSALSSIPIENTCFTPASMIAFNFHPTKNIRARGAIQIWHYQIEYLRDLF